MDPWTGFSGNDNTAFRVEGTIVTLSNQIEWSSEASGAWDTATNWQFSAVPIPTDDVIIDPVAALTVTGPMANRTVSTLRLGGSGAARATLRLESTTGGDLNVVHYAEIFADGELVLANGRSFVTQALYNYGLIQGTGTINAVFFNFDSGEVRVASGESLVISSSIDHYNAGKLKVTGGALEFIANVTNETGTGLIAGQSATLRFNDGLENRGSMALTAGINNVSGDITNNAGATITVTGRADAVFYDDMVQNGTLRVVSVGFTTSTAVFLGSFTGSGGTTGGGDIFFEGDLRPGNSPASVTFGNNVGFGSGATLEIELGGTAAGSQYDQVHVTGDLSLAGTLAVSLINGFMPATGNTFDILNWGTLVGTFNALELPTLAGTRQWNTSQLYSEGKLLVISGVAGDYNNDGTVNAADYTVYRNRKAGIGGTTMLNDPSQGIGFDDYLRWKANFGEPNGSGAGDNASVAVPEPCTAALALIFLCGVAGPRRRGR